MGRRRVSPTVNRNPRALPRFFVSPEELAQGVLPDRITHQVRHVLRLQEDDLLCLLDGTGLAHYVRLRQTGRELRFERLGSEPLTTELPFASVVLQALIRTEKAEQVVRLCTAAGAAQILFAPSERSLIAWDASKRQARQQRWQVIAREEAELACRARYPTVQILPDWATALENLPPPRLLLDEWTGAPSLVAVVRQMGILSPEVPAAKEGAEAGVGMTLLSLIVGPEGGFTPREREQMVRIGGCQPVSLGKRVLRTETAAFYALAQIAALL
jgi:16S rRNA (uracil1498-N3)-methyltransferase